MAPAVPIASEGTFPSALPNPKFLRKRDIRNYR
jgi:hypothetical protein